MFATKSKDPKYERKKLREANRQRQIAAAGREIGDLPPVANPDRRAAAERNFRLYCETYHPDDFTLAWSPDHLETIAAIETTVLAGGLFALAMPRGSGKTTLCEAGCCWAAIYGHHEFIVLIGADAEAAADSLLTVRTHLETNERLAEDFPAVCYPISKLEGIQQRRLLYKGNPLRVKLTKASIILPDIPGAKSANVIFRVAGITGRIRGMKYKRRDNRGSVRPSLCLIDDPQTDESAASVTMCDARERTISKAVRGLAGPGKKIAALMPCTVIRRGDVADRLLNRELHPAWHGRRYKLIYRWPDNMDLWAQYIQIRQDCQRADKPATAATKFYEKHREEMDAGAHVAWPARFNADEISALQNAFNLRYENKENAEEAFQCEYQNEPPDIDEGTEKLPTTEALQTRVGPYTRRIIAPEAAHLVAAVDVQGELLYWSIIAAAPNFTAWIPDYGTFPEQPVAHFQLKTATHTLTRRYPAAHADGRLYAGLADLVAQLLALEFKTPTGTTHRIERIGIDAGFKTALIHRFCREHAHAAALYPTQGRGIRAKDKPLRLYKTAPGEKIYDLAMLAKGATKARTTRHLVIDTNATKTFIFERFATEPGDPGSLQFYRDHPTRHRLFAEHLGAEYRKRTTVDARTIDEWSARPSKPDNHYLDTLGIGFALLNSIGCKLDIPGSHQPKPKPRRTREAEYL